MTNANTTDLPACASQDGAHPPIALTADAGAQTGRPVIAAVAYGDDYSPDAIIVTVDGATYTVDTSGDRDDWTLPEFDDAATEIRVMVAVEDAHRDYCRACDDDARCSVMAVTL